MIVALQIAIYVVGVLVIISCLVAWAKYERWLRERGRSCRTGDVEIPPSCSHKGRPR